MTESSIFKDDFVINHNGKERKFICLRNGGKYFFSKHPVKGHDQLVTIALYFDGPVLANHRAVMNIYRFPSKLDLIPGEDSFTRDMDWNWGFPMWMVAPTLLDTNDIDEMYNQGLMKHVVNGTFFGYTEFQRLHETSAKQ